MIRIGSIVLRVDDLQRQTEFWEAALGYVRRDNGESDDFVLLGPTDGVGAASIPRPGPVDVADPSTPPPRPVHRESGGGGRTPARAGRWRGPLEQTSIGRDHVILADAEGDRFCVVEIS